MRRLFLTMLVLAAVARAEDSARHFEIPAQDMQSALNEFARQSDRQILFATHVTATKRSVGIKGELDPEAALTLLLKGTGLTFRVTADRAILVENSKARVRRESSPAPDMSRPEARLEEVLVTATRREQNLRQVPQ